MPAWEQTTFRKVLRIKHGFAFKGEFFADEGEAILLTPGNFKADGGLKLKGDKEKFYAGPIPDEFVLRAGEILVAMTDLTQNAPILGSAAVIPSDRVFLHNQRLGKIVDIDARKATKEFLYYLFNSEHVRAQIRASATGATVRHTAPDRIYNVEISLPSLAVQRRIAGILSAYDDLIENCERRIRVLDEMTRALYREWFVHFRYPGHENTPLVDSELGRIPKGWEIKTVGECLLRRPNGHVRKEADVKRAGAVPVIDQSTDEVLGYHDEAPDHEASARDPLAIFGDHTCKMQLLITPFSIGPNVVVFGAKDRYPLHYVFQMIRSLVRTQEYKRHWSTLTSKEVVVADRQVAEAYAARMLPLFRLYVLLREQVRFARASRELVLPRLLSGELPVENIV